MQPMQGSTWRGRAAGVVLGALAPCGVAGADNVRFVPTQQDRCASCSISQTTCK